jgi:lysophospholipase L1-like esterase
MTPMKLYSMSQLSDMKIVVVGDSIAEGLGVKGRSYADLLGPRLREKVGRSIVITNLARTGIQITDTMRLTERIIEDQPDVIVIAHGVTEAIVRPTQRAMRYVPKRWHRKGWLDPRPYFSKRWHKRLYQQIESAIRWRLKVFLIKAFGGETWLSPQDYRASLKKFMETLLERTPAIVIVLTPPYIDEKFFPGSIASLRCYQNQTEEIMTTISASGRAVLCNVTDCLEQWEDFFADHFHPNASGHEKISQEICAILETYVASDMTLL